MKPILAVVFLGNFGLSTENPAVVGLILLMSGPLGRDTPRVVNAKTSTVGRFGVIEVVDTGLLAMFVGEPRFLP